MLDLADNMKKQIPENIDYEQTLKIMASDHSPLKIVLLQEVNILFDYSLFRCPLDVYFFKF